MRISDWSSDVCPSDLGQAIELLREGKPARLVEPNGDDEARLFEQAQLLTAKPVLYVCNVAEDNEATGKEMNETGRGSRRVRGCRYVSILVVSEYSKKQQIKKYTNTQIRIDKRR